jgi:hypothetical protein
VAKPDLLHTTSRNPLTVLHDILRVGKTRVTLDTVVAAFNDGASPEEIVARYPSLSLADVYGAIALYLEHREDVDGYISLRHDKAVEQRDQNSKEFALKGLRERLLGRRSQSFES